MDERAVLQFHILVTLGLLSLFLLESFFGLLFFRESSAGEQHLKIGKVRRLDDLLRDGWQPAGITLGLRLLSPSSGFGISSISPVEAPTSWSSSPTPKYNSIKRNRIEFTYDLPTSCCFSSLKLRRNLQLLPLKPDSTAVLSRFRSFCTWLSC